MGRIDKNYGLNYSMLAVLILSAQLYIEIVTIHSQWLATFLLICQTIVKRHTLWTMACITDIDAWLLSTAIYKVVIIKKEDDHDSRIVFYSG
jgi:phage-related baseplate assembly protein